MAAQMPEGTVLSVVVGSRAYGLDVEQSDVDRRGVFVVPTPLFWRFDKPPTHVEGPLPEQFSWEIERFCVLALRGNTTVLECLWSPLVEHRTEVGDRLLEIRRAFLSRKAVRAIAGYADDQVRRLDQHDARAGRPVGLKQRKMAMHTIRLLISGLHLVQYGEPLVRMDAYRDRLLAVRNGEMDLARAMRWRERLSAELRARADAGGRLSELPDRDVVERFLIEVRRSAL